MKLEDFYHWLAKFLREAYEFLTSPLAILLLTHSKKVHPGYGMTWRKRIVLGFRFWRNHSRVRSGTSWRAHLIMAMKLLQIPPKVVGDVVECGCWKGGATVNLSLICKITGRKLKVYDSFEGLPPPVAGDTIAQRTFKKGFIPGIFGGSLQEVTDNVKAYGAIDVCEFHKGWFENTLPHHEGDIVLMFLDVDFYSSLHDCLLNLWPSVVNKGFVFLDEYLNIPYCAVFYSEKYWDKYFSSAPPGLVGTGTGVQVGMYYTDPSVRFQKGQLQGSESIAYCIKGTRALWDFYPDEEQTPEAAEMDSPAASNN
jgi:Macrocin-O-methyltransferase (TylF)